MINTMMNGGMGLMMLGMLGMTLWILLLAVLIWALITWLNRRWNKPQPRQESLSPPALSAQEILSQRYARGEIDQATFQQMREQLGATSPSPLDEGTER
jgi:putative membrane protein